MYALAYSCIFDHSLKNASPVAQLVKNLPANAGDTRDVGSIPGLGRSPREGNGNLLQYSCLENYMDRRVWWATQSIGHNWECTHACSVAQLCLTLCKPMNCSPPGSSAHGIFQARILEQVAISYSRGSFQPRDQTHVSCVSCIGRWILYHRAPW